MWFDNPRRPGEEHRTPVQASSYDTWVDPTVPEAAEVWEQRLQRYAKRCAHELSNVNVPCFRSEWPREGKGTYRDSFWLIAVDVERGDRAWVENVLSTTSGSAQGNPPVAVRGDLVGWFRGYALLLARTGSLATAQIEGFFDRQGGVNGKCMDMLFHAVSYNRQQLQSYDWGWQNVGRWRRAPKNDISAYGIRLHSQSITFQDRWRAGGSQHTDGRGTSAALSAFVKNGGNTQWPRHFVSFDY